jgi:hypothetical protein
MRFVSWLAVPLLLVATNAAAADLEWKLSNKDGRLFLAGMPKESEVDNELWLHCRSDGAIDLGAGAESHVGRGNGEAVTLRLAAGFRRATLTGVSRESANYQMTSGVELRAVVTGAHPLFKVLANGKPIKVSGSIKPITWPVNGLKALAATFLKECK